MATPQQITRPKWPLVLAGVVLLLAGFIYWNYYRPWPIKNRLPSSEVIVMLGDSLTAGAGASPGKSWPELISEKLGKPIISAGISGDTTGGGLARLQRDVIARNPGTVILCLGGNDLLRRVPGPEILSNLEKIIEQCQDQGAMVLFAGVQGLPLFSSFGSEYKALARKRGVIYVPNILGGILTNRKLMADQIHPNSEGYEIMADRVVNALRPHLLP
jgi:lysophospholipase L1-like esterase